MTLTVERPHGRTEPDAIAATARELDVELPESYVKFLNTVGGGHTGDLTVPGTDGMGVLMELYSVSKVAEENSPDERVGFIEAVPDNYLVIGDGAGGALFLSTDDGSIWWADYDRAGEFDDDEPHPEIMTRLADDFDTFLASFE